MKKVLLIEDDKFLVRVYAIKLKKEGFETVFLGDGINAEEVTRKEKPDVIILDMVMPNRDGFETLKGLKSDEMTKKVPVIILTSLNSEEDKKTCLDLGAVEFIQKDKLSIMEVVDIIRNYAGA